MDEMDNVSTRLSRSRHESTAAQGLDRVSLTGVDDATSIQDLRVLSERYVGVEWALLYVPGREGIARNPSRAWRETFFDAALPGWSAVHWCGALAFDQLLRCDFSQELIRAQRWQLNINARRRDFDDHDVLKVYRRALDWVPEIILQYHETTEAVIAQFWNDLPVGERDRVHVLLDSSKGRGQLPTTWTCPALWHEAFVGFAGGLSPTTLPDALPAIDRLAGRYWIDMETGIRTDNAIDQNKIDAVLNLAMPYRKNDHSSIAGLNGNDT